MSPVPHSERSAGTSAKKAVKKDPRKSPLGADAGPVVVGIGASAGGLEAFSELLSHLPADTGLAFVLIQHLEPTHPSNLAEILGRTTPMPVVQAVNGMRLEPDHVYVIPPNAVMRAKRGALVLTARPKAHTPSLTVDIFLQSLAKEYVDRAIGVVLSGAASDGALGLTAIHSVNGITIVQDPATARYRGMPESAIAAGVVDTVLPVTEIGAELARLARHPYVRPARQADETSAAEPPGDAMQRILGLLKAASGLDLTHYKTATLRRRIERRMAVRRVDGYDEYLRILQRDTDELTALFGEVLVRVTSFFRDGTAFDSLASQVLPEILRDRPAGLAIRVWVAGCATGQEAYSVAIALVEHMGSVGSVWPVTVFASDLREGDLDFARRGIYAPSISGEVSAERLSRFFTRVEDGYRVNKSIREMCVFARHNVTADPPFARLDLVTCRNLLIYMDPVLQRRILTNFHYALVNGGALFIGESEGTSAAAELFERTDHKGIYRRAAVATPSRAFGGPEVASPRPVGDHAVRTAVPAGGDDAVGQWAGRFDELLVDRFSPAALMVDADLRVLQLRGDAGAFLRPRPGPASLDLMSMASEGLAAAVRSAIDEAATANVAARRPGLRVIRDGTHRVVDVTVIPMQDTGSGPTFAVLFGDAEAVDTSGVRGAGDDLSEVEYLRQELDAATDMVRAQAFRRDSANEELRAASEEIQSSNEELQSLNEELETAKEELESTNEELTTLNDELQSRNRELRNKNEDLNNLLASARIPILMLDADLAMRRYTELAAEIFKVLPGDVGRSISDIRSRLTFPGFEDALRDVLGGGDPVDVEVVTEDERWYRMSVTPYLTEDGAIDGVVVSMLDIDAMRRGRETLQEAARLGEALEHISSSFDLTDHLLEAEASALETATQALGADEAELYLLVDGAWRLETRSGSAAPAEPFSFAEVALLVPEGRVERRTVVESVLPAVGGRAASRVTLPIVAPGSRPQGAVRFGYLAHLDTLSDAQRDFCDKLGILIALVLERAKRDELARQLARGLTNDLRETAVRLEEAAHVKDIFLANMSHELRTPLNSIIGFSTVLLDGMAGDLNPEQRRQLEMVLGSGKHLLAIISDILDLEKIEAGAMPVTPKEFVVNELVDSVVGLLRPLAVEKGIVLTHVTGEPGITAMTDELKVRQILLNLVSNAVKFTDEGEVKVAAVCADEDVTLVVVDTGRGMTADELVRAFGDFQQVGDDGFAGQTGTGLGLSIARRLATLLGGELKATSTPGVGSTLRATVKRHFEA